MIMCGYEITNKQAGGVESQLFDKGALAAQTESFDFRLPKTINGLW